MRRTKYTKDVDAVVAQYVFEEGWTEAGDVVPTEAGLAKVLGISKKLLRKWASDEEKVDLRMSLDVLETIQENELIQKGLTKDFQPSLAKSILDSKHGYALPEAEEKQNQEIAQQPLKEVTDTTIDRLEAARIYKNNILEITSGR